MRTEPEVSLTLLDVNTHLHTCKTHITLSKPKCVFIWLYSLACWFYEVIYSVKFSWAILIPISLFIINQSNMINGFHRETLKSQTWPFEKETWPFARLSTLTSTLGWLTSVYDQTREQIRQSPQNWPASPNFPVMCEVQEVLRCYSPGFMV